MILKLFFLFFLFGQNGDPFRYALLLFLVMLVVLQQLNFFTWLMRRTGVHPQSNQTPTRRPTTFLGKVVLGAYILVVSLMPWWTPNYPPPVLTPTQAPSATSTDNPTNVGDDGDSQKRGEAEAREEENRVNEEDEEELLPRNPHGMVVQQHSVPEEVEALSE